METKNAEAARSASGTTVPQPTTISSSPGDDAAMERKSPRAQATCVAWSNSTPTIDETPGSCIVTP